MNTNQKSKQARPGVGHLCLHISYGLVLVVRHHNEKESVCETVNGRRLLHDSLMSEPLLSITTLLQQLEAERQKELKKS